mgnify:CR=1 FL=1
MPQTSIHINQRFGRLTVLELASTKKRRVFQWICRCDCGEHVIASSSRLKRSKIPSCGCYTIERTSELHRIHGYTHHPTYQRWKSMMCRCYQVNNPNYPRYGARGIIVCERWHNPQYFIEDMGIPPQGHTLERKDNNGPYSPDNCIWATRLQQGRNTRKCHFITFQEHTWPISVWAEYLGMKVDTLKSRFVRGWSVEKALTTPLRVHV